MTKDELIHAAIVSGILDEAAIHDAEGYDGGATLAKLDTMYAALQDEPEAEPVEHSLKGRCECGLTWQVHSGYAFEVKQVFCTCGRTVEVNRASENRGAPRE